MVKILAFVAIFSVSVLAECSGPKNDQVRVFARFKDGGDLTELLFVSATKEKLNSLPHVCVAQPTTGEPTYVVDISGIPIGAQGSAVSIAWGPSLYEDHSVATLANDREQLRDIARLMVDDIVEDMKRRRSTGQ